MNTKGSERTQFMNDGTPYLIQPCVEPASGHTPEFLKDQIARGLDCMSAESRWQRFASPMKRLSRRQLDYLADLDGNNRVGWCATVQTGSGERGVGLARYVRLPEETSVAEFAVTVVDEFHGQGIGRALMKRLLETAGENDLLVLRGFVQVDNTHMLSLCRRFRARLRKEDTSLLCAEIPVRIAVFLE